MPYSGRPWLSVILGTLGTTSADSLNAQPWSSSATTPERKQPVQAASEVAFPEADDLVMGHIPELRATDSHVILRMVRLGNDTSEECD
ncbi:hypothetical protein MRX96_039395 [Rhipicephalus microplus]